MGNEDTVIIECPRCLGQREELYHCGDGPYFANCSKCKGLGVVRIDREKIEKIRS